MGKRPGATAKGGKAAVHGRGWQKEAEEQAGDRSGEALGRGTKGRGSKAHTVSASSSALAGPLAQG